MARLPIGAKGGITFHGSFTSQLLARKKESQIPGSFIIKRGDRYYVLKPKTTPRSNSSTTRKRVRHKKGVQTASRRHANPGTLIYDKITRIEGTKGKGSNFAGQKFFHNFKRPYPQMWGLPDGSLLIKSKR
jgi:hypothetical protein